MVRTLGKGGMSKVFEAIDTHYDRRVALKAIRRAEGLSLLRFKEEFRSLAEYRHANLVELYDLVSDEDRWFFSMELIEGIDLITHVEAVGGSGSMPGTSGDPDHTDTSRDGPLMAPWHEVRRLFAEIGRALVYLHERGTIHRDLKPSNILVDALGRPRILDFGIARFTGVAEEVQTALSRRKVGTPGYVAPEQIKGRAEPASDIYSLGIILYRILTGHLPFRGRKRDVLVAHLTETPPPPGEFPGADPDLSALCERMIAKAPAERPTAADLIGLARLEPQPPEPVFIPTLDEEEGEPPLIGRDAEVQQVLGHLLEMTVGGAVMVCLDGPSGIGKTRLAEEVLDLARRRGVRSFRARCYEREQIPYKAFDAVVDQLVSTIFAAEDRAMLLRGVDPEHLVTLARVFPFAAELPFKATETMEIRVATREPQLRKAAAFEGLLELLGIAASDTGLLLFIDDLQWADDGSFELLDYMLRQRGRRLGIMATLRPGEGAVPEWVLDERKAGPRRIHHVPIGPIGFEQSQELVRALSPSTTPSDDFVKSVAEGADGNPLVVEELVRFNAEHAIEAGSTTFPITFPEMVLRRYGSLEPRLRQVIEICVAAAYALDLAAIAAAARLSIQETSVLAMQLADRRMLRRVAGREGQIRLFPFHDRATSVILDDMEPSRRRQIHKRLAEHLEKTDPDAFHQLADHWRLAGVPERASMYALRAAEHAEAMQLLDRAIRYYAMTLGFPPAGVHDWQIRVRLAEALDRRGRFTEAGRAFRDAARRAPQEMRTSLMLRGARAMLKSGMTPTAVRTMSRVAESLWGEQLILPRWSLAVGIAGEFLRSRQRVPALLRGVGEGASQSAEMCLELGQVLRFLLPWRAVHLLLRALRLARAEGDSVMVARVLVGLAGFLGFVGTRTLRRRCGVMLGKAEALLGTDPEVRGWGSLHGVRALLASLGCQWDDMRAATDRALAAFQNEGNERSWDAQMVRVVRVMGEVDAGDLRRAERVALELLPTHVDWDDLDLQIWVRWARIRIDLAFGRWEDAERGARSGLRACAESRAATRPLWVRYRGALAVALAGQGRDVEATTGLERTRLAVRRGGGLDPLSLAEIHHCMAHVYTAAAGREVGRVRERYLRRAREAIRRLRWSLHRPFNARALRWEAEVAYLDGHNERAIRLARRAVDALLASRQRLEASHALLTQARAELEAGHRDADDTRRAAARQLADLLRGEAGER